MAHQQDVFKVAEFLQQRLELGEGSGGRERSRGDDLGFVSHLRANQRSCLHGTLQRAGHDHVELNLHRVHHVRELDAEALTLLVQGAFAVEDGVGAPETGAGVPQDVNIHSLLTIVRQAG